MQECQCRASHKSYYPVGFRLRNKLLRCFYAGFDRSHTVWMRLRLTEVAERTQEVILWHSNSSMNSHYAIAQLREIYTALDGIPMPGHDEESLNLHAMIRQAQIRAVGKVTQKSHSNKKAA